MKKLIIAIVLIVAALVWAAGTYTTDNLTANQTVTGEQITSIDDIDATDTITGATLTDGTISITDGNIITDGSYIGAIPGADAEWYFFHESASGEANGVWVYGYPTGESLSYGKFKIISGPKFQITSDTGEIDYDNEHLRTVGWMQAEHLYSTDDAIVDDDANIGDELQVWGRALIGRDTLPLVAGPNCVAYWKMNDNVANTTVLDFIRSYNGVLDANSGSPNTDDIYGTGKIDGALELGDSDGVANAYISVSQPDDIFGGLSNTSIAFWFKSDGFVTDNYFMTVWDTQYSEYQLNISTHNDGGSILFGIEDNGGSSPSITSTDRGDGHWVDDAWHLCIVTYTTSGTASESLQIYIDNVDEGDGYGWGEVIRPLTNDDVLYISSGRNGLNVWDGWLDEVMIFNKVLDSDDRDGLWNSGSGQEYAENFNVYDNLNVIGGLAIIYPDHVTDVHDDLFIEGALEVYGSAYVETNLSVDGDITDVDDLTASGTITATNLAIDHIAEKTSAHNVVFDNDVNLGANDLTTTGTGTFNNLKIEGAIPILIFKDNTDTGDSARGFQEWRDSDNVRLGFFGNSSYTHDDLVWKNESSGGHLLLETTGIGIVSSNTDFTTTGAITGASLTDGTATLDDGSLTSAVNGTFSGTVQAANFISTVATGTQPYACTSTTLNTNLNADLWDGYQFADYLDQAVLTTSSPTFGYVNITDESNGYQVEGVRVLSVKGTDEDENIFIGQAGNFTMTGVSNLFIGYGAGLSNTVGYHNTGITTGALAANTEGNYNTAIGSAALYSNTGGDRNTVIGRAALYSNVNGNGSVAVGYGAGLYETASNKLFIDNQARADEADGRAKALIYGVFDADPANQSLAFNVGSASFGTGTLGAGAITGTSFIIGGNTLDTDEWANLDGLDQTVATTSTPTFAGASFTDDISIAAGKKFSLANGDVVMQRAVAGSTVFRVAAGSGASGNQGSGFYLTNDGANPANSANSDFGMLSLIAQVQLVQFVADTAGNQIVITNIANRNKDHDHALQTDPTLYVHSDTDPDTANTQWISLTHNKTDGVIAAGLGDVKIDDDLNVIGNTTLGDASTDLITCTGRWIPRTVAADPTANATAGSLGEIVFFNDKWYGKTVADGTDTNWAALN